MFVKIISLVSALMSISEGANILAILPTPSYSHQIAYTPLWKELSLRGHKVTVITTDPLKDPKLTNLTEIDMNWTYKFFVNISKDAETKMTMWNIYLVFLARMKNIFEAQLTDPSVQNLIHNKTSFDVVMVEFLYPEFLAFAEIYNCPKILFSSMDSSQYYHGIMGNPTHPLVYPDLATPFSGSLNFKERVLSTLFSWYLSYLYAYTINPTNQNLMQEHFNITLSVEELISDVDMLFNNVNPIIQSPRAIGPATINIGGERKPMFSKPLSKELQEFLDGAKHGFIYFSLGSNVKSKELNQQSLQAIIESLGEIPYKVLWKFEADELPGKPENVELVKWAPQENVLSHPNIKLFVTQGGLQSMEEAIYSAVPLVVIPFFGDQEKNAKLMKTKGIAEIIDRQPFIRKTDLKGAILEVINNPSYKNNVRRLKQLALDSPMTGLEKAVWWTEYVIRNKGAKHLRNPAADLPFYQYYLLDVIGFLIVAAALILSTTVFVGKMLFKLLYRFLHRSFLSKKKVQ